MRTSRRYWTPFPAISSRRTTCRRRKTFVPNPVAVVALVADPARGAAWCSTWTLQRRLKALRPPRHLGSRAGPHGHDRLHNAGRRGHRRPGGGPVPPQLAAAPHRRPLLRLTAWPPLDEEPGWPSWRLGHPNPLAARTGTHVPASWTSGHPKPTHRLGTSAEPTTPEPGLSGRPARPGAQPCFSYFGSMALTAADRLAGGIVHQDHRARLVS